MESNHRYFRPSIRATNIFFKMHITSNYKAVQKTYDGMVGRQLVSRAIEVFSWIVIVIHIWSIIHDLDSLVY